MMISYHLEIEMILKKRILKTQSGTALAKYNFAKMNFIKVVGFNFT